MSTRHGAPEAYKPNPPATASLVNGVNVSTQTLLCGGDYAVGVLEDSSTRRHVTTDNVDSSGVASTSTTTSATTTYWIAIANDFPASTSAQTASMTAREMQRNGLAALQAAHRTAWAGLYPASFITVAQSAGRATLTTALDGFYWNQVGTFHIRFPKLGHGHFSNVACTG